MLSQADKEILSNKDFQQLVTVRSRVSWSCLWFLGCLLKGVGVFWVDLGAIWVDLGQSGGETVYIMYEMGQNVALTPRFGEMIRELWGVGEG